MKSDGEVMEILEAYDLTGSCRAAAELAGCSHHTVAHYVAAREEGRLTPGSAARRPMLIDAFLPKVEEWVDHSRGKVRADVVHDKLRPLGYAGSERTTRRAVERVKRDWWTGRRREHRRWVPEPGSWFQDYYGEGPRVAGVATQLFYVLVGSEEPVAWWAHLGGFAAGLILAAGFKRADVALLGGR